MQKNLQKIFKDPLYDYIYIDSDICDKIIDNIFFQRLRRIEQTSMRCLYPSARHDRFIHSLGVYHLAKIAINSIENNELINLDGSEINLPDSDIKKSLRFTFEMAALLHDIAHSPFSHTLEGYFKKKYKKNANGDGLEEENLIDEFFEEAKIINSVEHNEDFDVFKVDCTNVDAAPHEIASCILIFRKFKEELKELADNRNVTIDFLFLARCILGAAYSDFQDYNDYKNCIIKILNSSIDVDKLDYIARDSSVSGFANTQIDTKRLLSSLVLASYADSNANTKLCLAFKKTAIGVIQNVVVSRNSLYTWIYSHHKVAYESHLIKNAIRLIADKEKSFEKKLFITRYFSVKNIENNLVCDDTIWDLFLKNRDIPEVNEIIQRNIQKKAVWKSFAEFQAYFNNENTAPAVGEFYIKNMEKFLDDIESESLLKDYLNKFDESMYFDVVINKTKLANIENNQIIIYINNKLYSHNAIFSDLYKKTEIPTYFYIYTDKETKRKLNQNNYALKNKLIEFIKNFDKFKVVPKE